MRLNLRWSRGGVWAMLAGLVIAVSAQQASAQDVTVVVIDGDTPNGPTDSDDVITIETFIVDEGSLPSEDPDGEPGPDEPTPVLLITVNGTIVYPPNWPFTSVEQLDAHLDNEGNLDAIEVWALGGNDLIDARDVEHDDFPKLKLLGGDGEDLIYGSLADDEIDGGAGDDIVHGGAGNDSVTGGPGNDLVRGDEGNDSLTGGGGWDVLDYATDQGPGSITVTFTTRDAGGTATDGWGNTDTVKDFSAIRGKATNDTLTGYTDAPTTIVGGAGDDRITGGDASDILIGEAGNDMIEGRGGSDYIIGGVGSDILFGGYATEGDDGGDFISGDGTADKVTAMADPAPPDLNVPDGFEDTPWHWPGGGPGYLEPVVPILGSDLFPPAPPGDEDSDNPGFPLQPGTVLVANLSVGADVIVGGPGPDTIYGGGGADRINGDDSRNLEDGSADVIFGDYDYDTDGIYPADGVVYGSRDGLFNFGNQLLAPGSDRIFGGAGPDILFGGGGDDTLAGGNDVTVLVGGIGDVLSGNAGSDCLIGDGALLAEADLPEPFVQSFVVFCGVAGFQGGSPSDTVDYTAAGTGIVLRLGSTVNADEGFALSDGDVVGLFTSSDTLYGIENVIGSPYDDIILGSDDNLPGARQYNRIVRNSNGQIVASASLMGYQAPNGFDNFLIGGFGNDIIAGGKGVDAVIGDYPATYLSAIVAALPADLVGVLVEGDDSLWGDGGPAEDSTSPAAALWPSSFDWGDDGEGHNDWIIGNGGNDEIHGQGGDDTIRGGTGEDYLAGDAGTDTLDYSEFTSLAVNAVRVNLSSTPLTVGVDTIPPDSALDGGELFGALPSIDAIENGRTNPLNRFEIVVGSTFITGAAPLVTAPPVQEPNDDVLVGHESLPTVILGLAGNDLLIGGSYDAAVATDPNQDSKLVYNGISLFSGDDYLDGGAGDDVIEPRTGNDYAIGGDTSEVNGDLISYARAPGPVTINLGSTVPQDTVSAGIDRLVGFEGIIGSDFNDTLTGNHLPNWIFGGAGDDLIRGGPDQDLFVNNLPVVREDYLVGGDGTDTVDYRFGNRAIVSVDLAAGYASNDGEGGSDRLFEIEEVLIAAAPMIVSAGPDVGIANGGSGVLTASVTGGEAPYTYLWTPADGLSDPTVLQPTAAPTVTTTYKLTVTDHLGKQASDFVVVRVAEPLTVNAGPDRSISIGQSVQLAAVVTGGVTPYTYVWTPADGLSRTDILRPEASPNARTEYTLTVTDAHGSSVSDTVVVNVTDPFNVSAGADVTIQPGQSIELNVIIDGGQAPYTILWTPTTGLSAEDVANPTASPASTTSYSVQVTDANGRVATDSVLVTVATAGGTPGGPGSPDGGSGSETPRTSPPSQEGEGEPAPRFVIPGCGTGAAAAMVMNGLLLLAFRRRRPI